MNLLVESDVPAEQCFLIARQSKKLTHVLPWVFAVVGIGGGALAIAEAVIPMAVMWTGLFALFALSTSAMCRAERRPTNWLLAAAPDGVYAKFRSYLNWGIVGVDPTVVFVPWSEVAAVRVELGQRLSLELAPGVDTRELASALGAERERKGPRGHTWLQYPVSLGDGPPRLTLPWRTSYDHIVPSLDDTCEALRPRLGDALGVRSDQQ